MTDKAKVVQVYKIVIKASETRMDRPLRLWWPHVVRT